MTGEDPSADEHDAQLDPWQRAETRRGRRRIWALYAGVVGVLLVGLVQGMRAAGTWPF